MCPSGTSAPPAKLGARVGYHVRDDLRKVSQHVSPEDRALLDEHLVTAAQTENWNNWVEQPILSELRFPGSAHDYDFVFVDSRWWADLSPESQAELAHACVDVYAEVTDNSGINFRRVLDIRDC